MSAEKNAEDPRGTEGDKFEISAITGGTVAVGAGSQAIGTLIKQIEETNVAGDYVERQEISNVILVVGSEGLDQLTAWLAKQQGLNDQVIQRPGAAFPSPQADRQIEEVLAAQKETAAKGIKTSPEAAYRLGMMAAYRRDYKAAINYFQEAAQTDPEYSKAFEGIAWLEQSLAMEQIRMEDYNQAIDHLARARTAAEKTDPLNPLDLSLRGYIAKTLAQIADAQEDSAGSQKYYAEAERMFSHVVKLDPEDGVAYNGLANVQYAAGNLDGAIASSLKAIEQIPNYTAAYHDLALAYEAKWRDDPVQWEKWCLKALRAWRKTYQLAPDDPAFTADKILQIGQRIRKLEEYCS